MSSVPLKRRRTASGRHPRGPTGPAGGLPPLSPTAAGAACGDVGRAQDAGLSIALEGLRQAGAARAGAARRGLAAVGAAAAAVPAGVLSSAAVADACRLVASHLADPVEETRVCACLALPPLQALLRPALAAGDVGAAEASKDAFVALLAQLGATSGAVRAAALEAMEQLPHWDTEAFVRAVKIPTFQKTTEAELAARPGQEALQAERWHGAFYFALDDELPSIRSAALRALRGALRRPELQYCKLLEGVFQRMAAVSTLCLIDDSAEVRQAASDTLLRAMESRGVVLTVPTKGSKVSADTVHVGNVLQALRVDQAVVFHVLRGAKFADPQALEVAVKALLEFDYTCTHAPNGTEEHLRNTLAHLGQAHAHMFEPAGGGGCINRFSGAGRCRGLGHRLFAQAVEQAESAGIVMTADVKDMGVGTLHVNNLRLERVRTLLRAVVAVRPAISSCVPGVDMPPVANPCCNQGAQKSLARWAEYLGTCYERLYSAACPQSRTRVQAAGTWKRSILPGRGARRGLRYLRSACCTAARESKSGPYSLTGNLKAIVAWSDLLINISEAMVMLTEPTRPLVSCADTSSGEELASKPPVHRDHAHDFLSRLKTIAGGPVSGLAPPEEVIVASGTETHIATSRLMHCFEWDAAAGKFPQALLAFRLLSLRLLAHGLPDVLDDLKGAFTSLGSTGDEAVDACRRPLHCFLPRLPPQYFPGLLGPGRRVVAHVGRLRGVSAAGRPRAEALRGTVLPLRFLAALGGLLDVEVETGLGDGVCLRTTYPPVGQDGAEHRQGTVAVPSTGGDLRTCRVPVEFPGPMQEADVTLELQLIIRVDNCSADDSGVSHVERGATGVAEIWPFYRTLNELPLGDPQKVPFVVTPTPEIPPL